MRRHGARVAPYFDLYNKDKAMLQCAHGIAKLPRQRHRHLATATLMARAVARPNAAAASLTHSQRCYNNIEALQQSC
jgi:hypothetical protein